mmetsp:Transcript_141469/g.271541  ORF Transcript_141469/g.271541 Transcript_141469/m.271541 type:complete len:227 (+) Transcript_141469:1441-2121(+)
MSILLSSSLGTEERSISRCILTPLITSLSLRLPTSLVVSRYEVGELLGHVILEEAEGEQHARHVLCLHRWGFIRLLLSVWHGLCVLIILLFLLLLPYLLFLCLFFCFLQHFLLFLLVLVVFTSLRIYDVLLFIIVLLIVLELTHIVFIVILLLLLGGCRACLRLLSLFATAGNNLLLRFCWGLLCLLGLSCRLCLLLTCSLSPLSRHEAVQCPRGRHQALFRDCKA